MKNIAVEFVKHIKLHEERLAIITNKYKKTYGEFLTDIMIIMEQIKDNEGESLIAIRPSYEFYVICFAHFLSGKKMVILETYKNEKLTRKLIELRNIQHVYVQRENLRLTIFYRPFRGLKVSSLKLLGQKISSFPLVDHDEPLLFTHTSGTTAIPKFRGRSLNDLAFQLEVIEENFDLSSTKTILVMLPSYGFVSLFQGYTTLFYDENNLTKDLLTYQVDTVLGSVSKILEIDGVVTNIKKCFIGGSYISKRDVLTIRKTMPNACIKLIYGATEVFLISMIDLNDYINEISNYNICLGKPIYNNVVIDKGEVVVGLKDKSIHTGDRGKIFQGLIYLSGKMQYSSTIFGNYELEILILDKFQEIEKCAAIVYKEQVYVFVPKLKEKVEEFLHKKVSSKIIVIKKKIPLDFRHHYKPDYIALFKELV